MLNNNRNTANNSAGMFLLTILQLLKTLAVIGIFIGIFIGLYLPLLGMIIGNPVSALWWLPVGFFIGAIAMYIQSIIIELVFFLPMAGATWLAMRGR